MKHHMELLSEAYDEVLKGQRPSIGNVPSNDEQQADLIDSAEPVPLTKGDIDYLIELVQENDPSGGTEPDAHIVSILAKFAKMYETAPDQ